MANKKKKASSYNNASKPQASSLIESLATPMEYIMRVFVLAIFIGIPLTFTDNATLVMAKQRTFFLMVILLGVAILFTVAFLLSQGNRLRFQWKVFLKGIRPYEYALFAYWVVMLLSAALSPFGKMGWTGGSTRPQNFLTQSCYILVFFLVSRFYKPSMKDLLIFCGVAALVGAYGICQYYKFDFLKLVQTHREWGSGLWLVSTMSNRNVASTYWSMAFCVAYVTGVRNTRKYGWLFFGLSLLLFYTLLINNTESGYLGILGVGMLSFSLLIRNRQDTAQFFLLLAGCCLLMWVHNIAYSLLYTKPETYRWELVSVAPNTGSLHAVLLPASILFGAIAAAFYYARAKFIPNIKRKTWHIAWFTAIILLLVLTVTVLPQIAAYTGNRSLGELNEMLHGNVGDRFMSGRAYVWKTSLTIIPARLLIGYGPDCYVEAYNRLFYQETMDRLGSWFDKPHNEYIQALVDTGILGFAALVGFYVLLYWAGRRRWRDSLFPALAVGMLCFLVQAFFNFATPVSHSIVWTMWGVLGAAVYMQQT